MGKTAKEVLYYNERYKGSLTDDQCQAIEYLLEIDKNNGYVSDLRHVIYHMADSDVINLIEDYETFGMETQTYKRPRGTLRDEQTVGVALMYHAKNCINGDSVGLGKTVETCGLYNLVKTEYNKSNKKFRCLVLTEKNIAAQFRSEMVKYTGEYVYLVKNGQQETINKFMTRYPVDMPFDRNVVGTHALLTTSSFISWLEQCRIYGDGFPFEMLVIDESSVLGGSDTGVVKNFKILREYFKRIIFLNATPFESSANIFFNQLNLLDKTLMPTKTNFEKEYCVMRWNGTFSRPSGKYKNCDEFRYRVGLRYFARTRKSKGAKMEDCSGGMLLSPLSVAQKELLKLTQLKTMVYSCPTHLDPSIPFTEEHVPKLADLKSLLEEECLEADSILIFSHFKESQYRLSEWLSNRGYSNRVLNGETKQKERTAITDSFKEKEYRILITNVQRGLNFGDCNHCIFFSFDPNPSKMIQFEGRTTREFDIVGKNVFILCSKGDEYKKFKEVLKERARATDSMTYTDYSVVMSILLGGNQ